MLAGVSSYNLIWNPDTLEWERQSQGGGASGTVDQGAAGVDPWLVTHDGAITSQATQYTFRVDEVSDTLSYIGEALPGTAEDASLWRVKKLDQTSGMKILFAGGDANFDNRWDQRGSLSYS